MSLADKLKEAEPEGFEELSNQPKWRPRKDRPPDMVLFATDGRELVHVIEYIGPGISYWLEEGLLDHRQLWEEFGTPFPGFWIWEGEVRRRVPWPTVRDALVRWYRG
jgi:hypothetical protein